MIPTSTIHFVYVKGTGISTPVAITHELSRRLSERYRVKIYDWADDTTIVPKVGDILLGHPNPESGKIFRNSFEHPDWSKRFILMPFHHSMPKYEVIMDSYLDDLVRRCDGFLAICGRYWIDTLPQSVFSHWAQKITRIDLAVCTDHFPFLKDGFNVIGSRRFVYIGHSQDYKGTDFFRKLAAANPEKQFGWIGAANGPSPNVTLHGKVDFATPDGRDLISSYDFLLTCGRADANPTTILEAAAWGLIPVCTPQCGYTDEEWFVNIPFGNLIAATAILNRLDMLDLTALQAFQTAGKAAIDRHYNWNRFAAQVADVLERDPPLQLTDAEWAAIRSKNQKRLYAARLGSAFSSIASKLKSISSDVKSKVSR